MKRPNDPSSASARSNGSECKRDAIVQALTLRLERLTQTLPNLLPGWRWEPLVRALMTFRGISLINSLTLVSEIGDFTRFDPAPGLMKFMGLVCSEHSTGQKGS